MDAELAGLRRVVAQHGCRRGKRYSPELRSRLQSWIRRRRSSGLSGAAIAAELSLPCSTVERWIAASKSSAALVPVEIVPEVGASRRALRVLSPGGWVIDGLTVEEAASLLRVLG